MNTATLIIMASCIDPDSGGTIERVRIHPTYMHEDLAELATGRMGYRDEETGKSVNIPVYRVQVDTVAELDMLMADFENRFVKADFPVIEEPPIAAIADNG